MKQTLFKTLSQSVLITCTAFGLAACKNAEDAVALVKGVAALVKGSSGSAQEAPPQAASFGFAPPAYDPAQQGDSVKNFKNTLEYTAANKQTLYFDRDGKYADKPQPGGYYREIIGKTADGRTVAQDFYQDSGLLQTAPFAFTRNGDLNSFEADGNTDSRLVQFDRQGRLSAVMEYKDGKAASPSALYGGGKLLAQMKTQPDIVAAYYEDGITVALVAEEVETGKTRFTLFRPDGSAISRITVRNGQEQPDEVYLWKADGSVPKRAEQASLSADAEAAEARFALVNERLKEAE